MVHTIVPEVFWAQRSSADDASKNVIFLNIILQDITNPKIDLSSESLKFSAESEGNNYAVNINFHDEIDVEQSGQHTTGRGVFMVLRKKKLQAEYWPRLTKEKARFPYIKTDFDRWVDEDEQEEAQEQDPMAGMDLSQLAAMSGGGDGGLDLSALAGAGGAGGAANLS